MTDFNKFIMTSKKMQIFDDQFIIVITGLIDHLLPEFARRYGILVTFAILVTFNGNDNKTQAQSA